MSQNGFCDPEKPLLRVKKLSQNAILPSRASALSAGYDLSRCPKPPPLYPFGNFRKHPSDPILQCGGGDRARSRKSSGCYGSQHFDPGRDLRSHRSEIRVVVEARDRRRGGGGRRGLPGPVGVLLFNHSDLDFQVKAGDRIAQLIIERIMTPEVVEVLDLDSTARGEGGFGSTGV
uniref:dUTP diphosphatase n=1 Tax=Ananas comosus var. bracteatus TaxID=296719 RepID=A0A6V7PBH0_ANACO|nr:unnamed protein product [Ananas comosus var. bracteatus]